MRSNVIMLILSVLSFVFSVCVYTSWRGYEHGLFRWGQKLIPFTLPDVWVSSLEGGFKSWVLYNFPDGLWMFSLSGLLLIIWGSSSVKQRNYWLILAFLTGFLLEMFQKAGLMSGTFDWLDMVAYILGIGTALSIYHLLNHFKWKSGLKISSHL